MSIKETAKFRILSRALQTSFGTSSEVKYPTHHVKANIISDNQVVFTCQTTVNFGHQSVQQEMRRKYIDECVNLVLQSMKKVEEGYKSIVEEKDRLIEPKKEPYEKEAPRTIKLKLLPNTLQDSVEYLSYSIYSPQKAAYFKIAVVAEIS